jgi:hypothetical protein
MTPDPLLKHVYWLADGNWVHRPRWKLWINWALMLVQWRSRKPWLLASRFEMSGNRPSKFLGFTWARIPVTPGKKKAP